MTKYRMTGIICIAISLIICMILSACDEQKDPNMADPTFSAESSATIQSVVTPSASFEKDTLAPTSTITPSPTATPAPTPKPPVNEALAPHRESVLLLKYTEHAQRFLEAPGNQMQYNGKNSQGYPVFIVTGSTDPYISVSFSDLNINTDVYPILQMKIKKAAGTSNRGSFYFETSNSGTYSEANRVSYTYTDTAQWQTVSVDLGANPNYTGRLQHLRFDVFSGSGEGTEYIIEYVCFFKSMEAAEKFIAAGADFDPYIFMPEEKPTPTPTITPTVNPDQTPTPRPTDSKDPYLGYGNESLSFSHQSGFYAQSFNLEIISAGGTVRFTRDGSMPSRSSAVYSQPIKLADNEAMTGRDDTVNVIRAAVFDNSGKRISEVISGTFIINSNYAEFQYRYNDLAVISLITDPDNLYDPDRGIFYQNPALGSYEQNYMQRGMEWERECHVEFFDSDGSVGFAVDAGLRVFGGTSRGNPQKSLKLIARKDYDPDNGKFKYPLFPDKTDCYGKVIDRYNSFILRAGGNDNLFGSGRNTFFRDDLVSMLAGGMTNIDYMHSRTAVVYINGQYWGFYNIRNDYDSSYLEEQYRVDPEDVAIVTYGHENGNWFTDLDEGTEEDKEDYLYVMDYLSSLDMSKDKNYQKAQELIDIDSFSKYMAVNMFANNRDWPHNNVRAWKYTGEESSLLYHNNKWRFMIKDTDYAWGIYFSPGNTENVVASETAHTSNVLGGNGGSQLSEILARLLKNKDYRTYFVNLVCDMCSYYFSAEQANEMIDSFVARVEAEFKYMSTQSWYDRGINKTFESWRSNGIQSLRDYANERPEVFLDLIRKQVMGGSSTADIHLKVNGGENGEVTFSTIVLENSEYEGEYFTGIDIPLKVKCKYGYDYTVNISEGKGEYKDGVLVLSGSGDVTIEINITKK